VKANIGKVREALEKTDKLELLKHLESSGKYLISYEGGEIDLTSIDLQLSYRVSEGYVMSEENKMLVFIATKRDKDLIAKGLLRDVARNLQQLRKEYGYNPTDILSSATVANLEEEEVKILSPLREDLMYLVRVKSVTLLKQSSHKAQTGKIIDLDGRKLMIYIEQ
jgi:isoleucyl-tRNA synthetase